MPFSTEKDFWTKPFKITSVCRDDLKMLGYKEEVIRQFDDFDMERLASKMANAYCENTFWIDLEILADSILEDKKEAKKHGAK